MDISTFSEVKNLLDISPQPFTYYKDQYAVDQLMRITRKGPKTVAELKKGRHRNLLTKPVVRQLLATIPDGKVTPERLQLNWWEKPFSFNRSLGRWGNPSYLRGNWPQLSRPGFNLVVQLNLTNKVVQMYQSRLGQGASLPCGFGHPVNSDFPTLGWARLDFELDGDSVLIEELQSDLVRDVLFNADYARTAKEANLHPRYVKGIANFVKFEFAPYIRLWQEVLLAHTLDFIDRELGFRQVFLHTWEGGNHMKNLPANGAPPRSLYQQLPKRFGFQLTDETPDFLLREQDRRLIFKYRNNLAGYWKLAW